MNKIRTEYLSETEIRYSHYSVHHCPVLSGKTPEKIVPEILQLILVPGLCLIIMLPVMLTVVGPVGIWFGFAV